MINDSFLDYILDILLTYGNVKSRRIFGGHGIYASGIMFAIIINNEIYFKADNILAKKYKVLGSYPFSYKRDNKIIALSYWIVPQEVLEDVDQLKSWFDSSLEVAKNNRKKKIYE